MKIRCCSIAFYSPKMGRRHYYWMLSHRRPKRIIRLWIPSRPSWITWYTKATNGNWMKLSHCVTLSRPRLPSFIATWAPWQRPAAKRSSCGRYSPIPSRRRKTRSVPLLFYYSTGQDVLLISTIDVKRLERERLSMLTLSDRLFLSYSSPILLVGRVPAVNQWRRRPTSQQLSTGAATPGAYRTRPIRFHQDGRLVGRLPCAHRRSFGILTRITTAPDKNQQQ